jgi:hypothetical protein
MRPHSGMGKCDLAKFKQPAVTFFLLVKIVRMNRLIERREVWSIPARQSVIWDRALKLSPDALVILGKHDSTPR